MAGEEGDPARVLLGDGEACALAPRLARSRWMVASDCSSRDSSSST
jgi:hypothetical protein